MFRSRAQKTADLPVQRGASPEALRWAWLAALLPANPSVRALAASTLAGSAARGLFVTLSVVFFTRSVGLSAAQVGVGLTVAALVGLLVNVPAGHLADIIGPRRVTVAAGLARALVLIAYLMVDSFWTFLVVATAVTALEAANGTGRSALIATAVPREDQVRSRAILRSVTNVGWAFGAGAAGIALGVDQRSMYVAMIWVCVALSLLATALVLRVPRVAGRAPTSEGPKLIALRDRPYVALTVLNGVLSLHYGLINVVVPLWVVSRTSAPAWVVAAMLLLNATTVALFQVRASRGSEEVAGGARMQRISSFLLLGACVLYALSAGPPSPGVAVAVLLAGAAIHVLGEMQQAAGGWSISLDLAAPHAHGQYQGLYGMGFGLANMVAPALLTAVVLGGGWVGWLGLGLVFVAAGVLTPITVRWAQRSRPLAPPVMTA